MKESADDHFARKNTLMPLVRFQNPENVTLKDLDDMKIALENLAEHKCLRQTRSPLLHLESFCLRSVCDFQYLAACIAL